MSDYNLGTARGTIEVGYKGDGVKQAEGDLNKVTGSSARTNKALGTIAKGSALAGGAIAAGLGLAVKSASDFEHGMSAIAAVSGATNKQMDQVRGKALQLGKDTVFSAGEASNAIEELVKNGLTIPDVMNGAADATVNLAAAGQIDLPQAAEIASAAMNHFGLAAKDLPHVADLLSSAADRSASTVGDLGEAMKYVGPTAYAAGVSLDDTAVSLAELAKFGIKGSMAGTTMRQMLLGLTPQSKKAAETMKALGIITKDGGNKFYDAQGKMKPMAQVAQVLQNSLKGLTKQQQTQALATIFGSRALSGAAVLAGQGKKGFDALQKSMGGLTAAEQAEKRMDNLQGSLQMLKGSMETLAIGIGSIMLPILKKLVDHLVTVANWFLNLSPEMKKFIVIFASITATLLLGVAAFIKITKAIKAFREAMAVLRELQLISKVGFLASPWVLGILAVIAVIALLVKYHKQIFGALKKAWDAIFGALKKVWHAIEGVFKKFIGFIKDHWKLFLLALLTLMFGPFGLMIGLIVKFWSQIKAVFTTALNAVLAVWRAIWGEFGPLVKAVFGAAYEIIKLILTLIAVIVYQTMRGVYALWKEVWRGIKAVVVPILHIIGAAIKTYFHLWEKIIKTVMHAIQAVIRTVWGWIRPFVMAEINGILAVVHGIEKIVGIVSGAFRAAWSAVRSWIGRIVSLAGGIASRIVNAIGDLSHLLYDAGKKVIQGLIDGITSMFGALGGVAKKATGFLGKFLPGSPVKEGPLKVLNNGYAGKQIVKMLVGGIDSGLPELARIANAMASHTAAATGLPTAGSSTSISNSRSVQVINNYPKPEPTSESLPRTLRNLEFVGALG